jgi:hypothetical protein
MASKTPSTKEDSTLEGNIAKPSSTYESSIKKRDSAYSAKQSEAGEPCPTEKALEEAAPQYDESKILHGRRLFFAFVAMMLSVLLIALGAFYSSAWAASFMFVICRPNHYCPRAVGSTH